MFAPSLYEEHVFFGWWVLIHSDSCANVFDWTWMPGAVLCTECHYLFPIGGYLSDGFATDCNFHRAGLESLKGQRKTRKGPNDLMSQTHNLEALTIMQANNDVNELNIHYVLQRIPFHRFLFYGLAHPSNLWRFVALRFRCRWQRWSGPFWHAPFCNWNMVRM